MGSRSKFHGRGWRGPARVNSWHNLPAHLRQVIPQNLFAVAHQQARRDCQLRAGDRANHRKERQHP